MLIGPDRVASESGEWLDSIDPANEMVIGRTPRGNARDVGRAVDAAATAQPGWAALPVEERANLVQALAERCLARAEEITAIEVRDTGNTINTVRRDVDSTARTLRYYAGLALEIKGETIPASPGNLHFTEREPYGVVGRIVPFNHPFMFAGSRIAPPLIAGNTVVVKPPEQSPLSSAILAELCRAILPPGVVNIVTGLGAEVGDALVRHPRVKRLAFTGSVPTGLAIQRAAAETSVKHVSLELGGKNPMIVFPDADIDRAIEAAVAGMNFGTQGQSCGSTSRLMVHESVYDRVLEGVAARVDRISIGDPMAEATEMGPLNSKPHFERVLGYVARGKDQGAKLVAGGARPGESGYERGFWLKPTVFGDVTAAMTIAREEIFGPVLSVMRWSELDRAIEIANGVEYALSAAIWTRDIENALKTARRIHAGYVWINGSSRHFLGTPFGGMKNSGTGREEGIDDLISYTEVKTVHVMLD